MIKDISLTVTARSSPDYATARKVALTFLPLIVAAGIFILDTITATEITVAVFYVVVVLLSVNVFQRRGVILVSLGCLTLTILGYLLTPKGSPQSGAINSMMSVSAIVATSYLVLKIEAARQAVTEARAELMHVARVTTLGELAVSISHEINQPLAAMVTNADACSRWLAHEPPNMKEAKLALDRISNDGRRASDVVGRITALAKRQSLPRSLVDLNEIITDVVSLTQSELLRNQVYMRTVLDEDLPPILGDRVQLQQVLLNLILNAIESFPAGAADPREIEVQTTTDGAMAVLISITDTGAGLEQNVLDRIFDPFFTTKPNGTGMGLSISRSIIESHGGRVWAKTGAKRGATFFASLPTAA